MSRKPPGAALVAVLLVASVGAVFLVFGLLNGPVGGNGGRDLEGNAASSSPSQAAARAPSVREPIVERAEPQPVEDVVDDDPPADPAATGNAVVAAEAPEELDQVTDQPAEIVLELIRPAEEEPRTVTVKVTDASGDPVPGALAVVRQGQAILFRDRADGDGIVEFEPYPDEEGPFRVDALAHGFVPGTAPSVAAGADTEVILEARPVVVGDVVGYEGMRGIVKLFSYGKEIVTKIRPDGSFRFEDLDAGPVTVQAEVEQYGIATQEFFLQGGTSRYVKLRIRRRDKIRIYGKVQGWPGKGAMWINGISAAVNPSGSYTFDHGIHGINEAMIDAPGRALYRERFVLRALEKSRRDFLTFPQARIRGRVRKLETNRSVEGAEVRLGYSRGDPRNDRVPLFPIDRVPVVRSDRDGRFLIERLDKRLIYLVSVVANGFGQSLTEAVPDGGFQTVKLPEGPFLFGRLGGLGGLPKDAVIVATPVDGVRQGSLFNVENWNRARSERDRKGFYGLSGLLPGTHHIRVEAPNFGSLETVIDLLPDERVRLDLRLRRGAFAEDDEANLLARLPPVVPDFGEGAVPPSDVTVICVDARRTVSEVPFDGVEMRFFEGDGEFAPPMDFDELEFALHGLPEATYRAILTHPNLKKPLVRDQILLRRGKPITIEFR